MPRSAAFGIEAHRGTRACRPENTLPAFLHALAVGVTAVELDVGVSADGVVIVSHERRASEYLYRDTVPVVPGDARFPYVGRPWRELTLERIQTLEAGLPGWSGPSPDREGHRRLVIPGTHVPSLGEVFELVRRVGAAGVGFEIEAKRDPRHANETIDVEPFVRRIVETVRSHRMEGAVRLRSFDWSILLSARRMAPWLPLVALASADTVFRGSPWTCGLLGAGDPWSDSLAVAAWGLGAVALAPEAGRVTDALIDAAHARGLEVIPWTVNDALEMGSLIGRGVDGLTTDDPRLLRKVLASLERELPPPVLVGDGSLAS